MNDSPVLKDERAVVFGAGGSIGAAVARKFGAEGAEVFLAGRTESTLDAVTRQITESGGQASYAVIDTLDDSAVEEYLDRVVKQAGGIDIEFNATGPRIIEYGSGKPAADLPVAEFMVAQTVLTSQFITARGAARRMVAQGSGVIIFLTGSPARPHGPGASGIGAAFGGIENLTRTMALELNGTGVRVVCLRTAANPDTRTIQDTADTVSKMINRTKEQVLAELDQGTWLKGSPHTEDTANGAVLPRWLRQATGPEGGRDRPPSPGPSAGRPDQRLRLAVKPDVDAREDVAPLLAGGRIDQHARYGAELRQGDPGDHMRVPPGGERDRGGRRGAGPVAEHRQGEIGHRVLVPWRDDQPADGGGQQAVGVERDHSLGDLPRGAAGGHAEDLRVGWDAGRQPGGDHDRAGGAGLGCRRGSPAEHRPAAEGQRGRADTSDSYAQSCSNHHYLPHSDSKLGHAIRAGRTLPGTERGPGLTCYTEPARPRRLQHNGRQL